jgi:hypothetical protein
MCRHVKLTLPRNGSLFDRHRQLHSNFRGEVVPVERGACVAASTARSWMSCCISRSRFRGGGLCDSWTNSPGRRRTTGRPGDGAAVISRTTGSPDSTFPTQTLPYRVSCAVPRVSRSVRSALQFGRSPPGLRWGLQRVTARFVSGPVQRSVRSLCLLNGLSLHRPAKNV